jgi:hypothetical protein
MGPLYNPLIIHGTSVWSVLKRPLHFHNQPSPKNVDVMFRSSSHLNAVGDVLVNPTVSPYSATTCICNDDRA